ncbi:MAG: helix-turn-helix domain-containing protein [Terrimicrobiaceae bacterium]
MNGGSGEIPSLRLQCFESTPESGSIQALIAVYGEARATDLAKWLGVTHVTVIRTVERLRREGLVSNRPTDPFS